MHIEIAMFLDRFWLQLSLKILLFILFHYGYLQTFMKFYPIILIFSILFSINCSLEFQS